MASTKPNPRLSQPFSAIGASLVSASDGFWLDHLDVIGPGGSIRQAMSALIWQGRIFLRDPKGTDQPPLPDEALAAELPRFCGREHMLMPGFINSHTHIPMALFKDLASASQAQNLSQNHQGQSLVENLFFTVEQHLTPDIIEGLCYPSLLEALHTGTTAMVDSYFFSDQVASAMKAVGMRGFVSEHFADLGGPHQKGLQDWPAFRRKIAAPDPEQLVGRIVYAHATDTVSRPLLTELASFVRDHGFTFHMHLAQSFGETARTRHHAGLAPIPYAIDCGAVSERSVLVHLVDATPEDVERLKPLGPTIALCPVSEVLYETLPNLPMLIDSGLKVLLGTDCPASNDGFDMGEELRALAMLYKLQSGKFLANAKALDQVWGHAYRFWFDQEPLADGSFADFSLIAKNLSLLPIHDMASHIIYSHITRHIDAVFIGGKLLSRHGRYVGGDVAGINRRYEQSIVAIERLLADRFGFKSAGAELKGFMP